MRSRYWTVAALVGCAAVTTAMAQSSPAKSPPYDVKAEISIRGKVTAVAAIPDWMGKNGVNLTLETPESVLIHVDTAPAEFLKMLDFAVAAGDEIEVTGAWSQWDGNRVFLARSVTRQKVAVLFRDPDGKPVW